MKKRIVVVTKEEISSWVSCQSIVGNLARSYSLLSGDFEIIFLHVATEFNSYQAYKTARSIKQHGADTIAWIDHSPNPGILIKALTKLYSSEEKKPGFFIHVFGDFVLDCLKWNDVMEAMKIWPIHFVTASFRQQKLLESFFFSTKTFVSTIPFPVNTETFNANSFDSRESIRKRHGVGSDDIVFLYTGRVSFQKNIETLVRTFESISLLFDKRVHLWIAGGFDDILLPYFGKHGITGSYYTHLSLLLDKNQSKHTRFLGHFNQEELAELYQTADVFISLSTYNDEDFGMAPAEALCCGLPAILSDWGGYSSFQQYRHDVELIPVSLEGDRAMVQSSILRKVMIKTAMAAQASLKKRHELATKAMEHLSIETVSEKLREKLSDQCFTPLEGRTVLFEQMCESFRRNRFAPFKNPDDEKALSESYRNIYHVYCD